MTSYWSEHPPTHIAMAAAWLQKPKPSPAGSPIDGDRVNPASTDMSAEDFLRMMPGGRIV